MVLGIFPGRTRRIGLKNRPKDPLPWR